MLCKIFVPVWHIKAERPEGANINWVDIENCDTTKCQAKKGERVHIAAEFVSGLFVFYHKHILEVCTYFCILEKAFKVIFNRAYNYLQN